MKEEGGEGLPKQVEPEEEEEEEVRGPLELEERTLVVQLTGEEKEVEEMGKWKSW